MRFERFIYEGTMDRYYPQARTKDISDEEFVSLAKKNCRKYISRSLTSDDFIFRGAEKSKTGNKMGDSTKSAPRLSANTKNYYTLWMDNHPQYKGFPKRSQSYICYIGKAEWNYAGSFGEEVYWVLPYDNAKIGVANASDLWSSFRSTSGEYFSGLSDFNKFLSAVFNTYTSGGSDESWDKVWSKVKEIDKLFKNGDITFNVIVNDIDNLYRTYSDAIEKAPFDSLSKFIEHVLDPKKNELKIIKPGDSYPKSDRECWIEGPCLFTTMRFTKKGLVDYIKETLI